METPDFSHLYKSSNTEFESVYEPSNDSFLFLDALEQEIDNIVNSNPLISLEVGSGSGIISSFMRKALKERNCNLLSFCTDLNIAACKSTKIMNNVVSYDLIASVDVLNCNLACPLISRLKHSVDIILFNPPYVPTPSEEVATFHNIETAAWAGGINGVEVIYKFLKQTIDLISKKGCLYLLIVKENNLSEIVKFVTDIQKELKWCIILSRKCRNEFLSIVKFFY